MVGCIVDAATNESCLLERPHLYADLPGQPPRAKLSSSIRGTTIQNDSLSSSSRPNRTVRTDRLSAIFSVSYAVSKQGQRAMTAIACRHIKWPHVGDVSGRSASCSTIRTAPVPALAFDTARLEPLLRSLRHDRPYESECTTRAPRCSRRLRATLLWCNVIAASTAYEGVLVALVLLSGKV